MTLRRFSNGARGEQRLVKALAALRKDGYVTVDDFTRERGEKRWNADHVVLGPTGVTVIETKTWTGRVTEGPGTLMCSGVDVSRTLSTVAGNATEIARRLATAGVHTRVQTLVVLTATRLDRRLRFGEIDVVDVRELARYLREGRSRLSAEEVTRGYAAILRDRGPRAVRPAVAEGPETATR
jgi:hypothetical protein